MRITTGRVRVFTQKAILLQSKGVLVYIYIYILYILPGVVCVCVYYKSTPTRTIVWIALAHLKVQFKSSICASVSHLQQWNFPYRLSMSYPVDDPRRSVAGCDICRDTDIRLKFTRIWRSLYTHASP
jgi:hypothetical protein